MSKEITKLEIELSNLTGLWFAGCLRTKRAKRWAHDVLTAVRIPRDVVPCAETWPG